MPEKTFTQIEVDEIVQTRINRERRTLRQQMQTERDGLRAEIDLLRAELAAVHADLDQQQSERQRLGGRLRRWFRKTDEHLEDT